MFIRKTYFIFGLIILLINCSKTESSMIEPSSLPALPYEYAQQPIPAYLKVYIDKRIGNFNDSNPITNDGATLGRVLFYDKFLSFNNSISCASCHKQEIGFTDDQSLSRGFMGGNTRRNSMSILNVGFQFNGKMFWDERAQTVEHQVLMPIHDKVEMGLELGDLVVKLNTIPYYKPLFLKAFGTPDITEERIARALSQFVRSIIAYRSKYDRYLMHQIDLTELELIGKRIFEGQLPDGKFISHDKTCIFCHSAELQLSTHGKADGDPLDLADKGVGELTGLADDMGRFKSPSLRNITQSAPYLHNGSILTLDSLLLFHANENPGFTFSQGQYIAALKAFLETLTDYEITKDEKFSTPFK